MKKSLKNFRYKIFLLLFDRKRKADFFPQKRQKLLFSHLHNFLGDTIISTYIYPILKQNGYEVHVLSQERNACILENDENLNKKFHLKKNFFHRMKTLFQLRKENYALLIIMNEYSFKRKHLAYYNFIKAKNIFSFNSPNIKLINLNFSAEDKKHIMERYEILLNFLKIEPPKIQQEVQNFLQKNNYENYLTLNPYGSIASKRFSEEQLKAIINFLLKKKKKILILGKVQEIQNLAQPEVLLNPFKDFLYSVELLGKSNFLISPDTSFIHAASAFNLPLLACYRNESSSILWKPKSEFSYVLFCENEKEAVSEIKIEKILKELEKLLT